MRKCSPSHRCVNRVSLTKVAMDFGPEMERIALDFHEGLLVDVTPRDLRTTAATLRRIMHDGSSWRERPSSTDPTRSARAASDRCRRSELLAAELGLAFLHERARPFDRVL